MQFSQETKLTQNESKKKTNKQTIFLKQYITINLQIDQIALSLSFSLKETAQIDNESMYLKSKLTTKKQPLKIKETELCQQLSCSLW